MKPNQAKASFVCPPPTLLLQASIIIIEEEEEEELSLSPRFEGWGCSKRREKKLSEWGLPGVESLGGPGESVLHLSRASQLPYNAKFKKNAKDYKN